VLVGAAPSRCLPVITGTSPPQLLAHSPSAVVIIVAMVAAGHGERR
jgi:hypothetical protein